MAGIIGLACAHSKAFDTVKSDILMRNLEKVLNPDELHILSILTKKPALKVTIDKECSEAFETSLGIMQGDFISCSLHLQPSSMPKSRL